MVDAFAIKTVTVTINSQDFTGTASTATGTNDPIVIEIPYALKGKTATFKSGTTVNGTGAVTFSGWPGTAPAVPTESDVTLTATDSAGTPNTASAKVSISLLGAIESVENVNIAGWYAYKKVKLYVEYVTGGTGYDLRAALGKYISVREVIGIQGGAAVAYEFNPATGKIKLFSAANTELASGDKDITFLILE